MEKHWKYLAVVISIMLLTVFSVSGCATAKNKEKSATENVIENDLEKESETQKSGEDTSNSSNNFKKSSGFYF